MAGAGVIFPGYKKYLHPFLVEFSVRSKKRATATFRDTDDFWGTHKDPLANKLNLLFEKRGWVFSIDSTLLPDKKTVLTKKIYKNKAYFSYYEKLWEDLSGSHTKEEELVDYLSIKYRSV